MTETLVSYELAVLLKEKGFNIPTQKAYINKILFVNFEESCGESEFYFDADDFYENWNYKNSVFDKKGNECIGCKLDNIKWFEACSAPTLSLAQKWLREVHDIEVIPCPRYNNDNILYYCYEVIKPKMCSIEDLNKDMFRGTFDLFNTYEQALEEGLLQGLKLTNI